MWVVWIGGSGSVVKFRVALAVHQQRRPIWRDDLAYYVKAGLLVAAYGALVSNVRIGLDSRDAPVSEQLRNKCAHHRCPQTPSKVLAPREELIDTSNAVIMLLTPPAGGVMIRWCIDLHETDRHALQEGQVRTRRVHAVDRRTVLLLQSVNRARSAPPFAHMRTAQPFREEWKVSSDERSKCHHADNAQGAIIAR